MDTSAANILVAVSMLVVLSQPVIGAPVERSKNDVGVAQVTPRLWRGPAPDEHELEGLASRGIRTIIDLRVCPSRFEADAAKRLGMTYVHLPLGYFAPSRNHVGKFLQIVNDDAKVPVFVHCRQGADRTGVLVAIYRRVVQHWTFQRAYTEMRTYCFKPWLFALREAVEESSKNYARLSPRDTALLALPDGSAGL